MSMIQAQPLPSRNGAGQQAAPSKSAVPTTPLMKIEKQYRAFLNKRYMAFALRAYLWTGLVLSGSILLYTGVLSSVVLAWPLAVPVFVSLAILLRVRKSYITNPPKQVPRPTITGTFISSLWNERAITLLFTYAVFSLTISNTWCILAGTDYLALFSPTNRYKFALNERRVVLCAFNLVLSLVLGARDILGDRLKPVWPQKRVPLAQAAQVAITEDLNFESSNSLSIAVMWSLVAPFAYRILLRSYVWQWVNWSVWSIFFRPFIGSFARHSTRAPSAWSLAPQLLVLDIVTLLVLYVPVKGMMPYLTQPLQFEPFYKTSPLTPERYLITALKSEDPYYLQFTLMELLRVVNVPARRKALFDDISKSPSLNTELWQALLLQLGRAYSNVSAPLGPSRTPVAQARPAPDAHTIPVKQGDIFRPITKQKSAYDLTTVLDGPIRAAQPEPLVKVSQLSSVAAQKAEQVQGQVLQKIEASPIAKTVVTEAQGWRQGLYDWAGGEWAQRSLRAGVTQLAIAQRIVEIMTVLSIASIKEDTYGHVQQVLPGSLEAIVRLRSAISSMEGQLSYQAGALGRGQSRAVAQIQKELGAARNACEHSVRRIGEAFGASLGAFKFPPSIAQTLGDICRS